MNDLNELIKKHNNDTLAVSRLLWGELRELKRRCAAVVDATDYIALKVAVTNVEIFISPDLRVKNKHPSVIKPDITELKHELAGKEARLGFLQALCLGAYSEIYKATTFSEQANLTQEIAVLESKIACAKGA